MLNSLLRRTIKLSLVASFLCSAPSLAATDGCGRTGQGLSRFMRRKATEPAATLKSKYPEIYALARKRLAEIQDRNRLIAEIQRATPGALFENVFDGIRAARNDLAAEIRGWAADHGDDPVLAQALTTTADRIELKPGGSYYKQIDFQRTMTLRNTCRGQVFNGSAAQMEALFAMNTVLQGEAGEMLVAFETPRLKRRSLKIRELAGAERLSRELQDKEIDIVYDDDSGREVWREVKAYNYVFNQADRPKWFKLINQLRATQEVAEALGLSVALELHFTGGITSDAKAELIRTYGVIVSGRES